MKNHAEPLSRLLVQISTCTLRAPLDSMPNMPVGTEGSKQRARSTFRGSELNPDLKLEHLEPLFETS